MAVACEATSAQGSEAAEATVRDMMTQMNYYYRQKEKNVGMGKGRFVDRAVGVSANGGVSDEPCTAIIDTTESCQRGGM